MAANKMTTIKDRILQLADTLGIGRKKFAEEIGMAYSSFTGKARKTPLNSTAVTNLLVKHPEVNANWLFTGEGRILVSDANNNGHGAAHDHPACHDASPDHNTEGDTGHQAPATGVPTQIVERILDKQDRQGEIMLSQQRTIEKLVDKLPDGK